MMNRKAEPEIRFKGFTDSWEQRKLSGIAEIVGGGTPSTSNSDYWNGDIDWYAPAEIGEKIFANGSIRKITKDGLTHSSAKILPANKTVLFTSRAGIGNMAILQRSAATNQGFQSLVCHDDIDPYFVFSMGDSIKTKAERVAAGSTFAEISGKKLGDLDFMFPGTDEQKAIGAYFKSLDHLITLYQRKCDKLCDFKKALLCNMFPAAEADAPKVRFKGYTKPWKHWTLGELYTERKEAGNDDLPILSVSIHSGVSADELDSAELGKAVRRSEDKSLYKHTYKGDLVFNMMRAWQGAIGVVPKEGMVSPAYITAIPNDEVFPEFMDYCLRREEVINQINNLSYGVTDFRKRLYWDSFVRVQIMLPSVEEQKKITATLVQLDELIELQSAKVERLKNLKAACLEKMFV